MSSPNGSAGDWWDEWVIYHLTIFGRTTQQDAIATVSLWRKVFVPAGYKFDDMVEGTNYVAVHKPPKFLNEHLPALVEALHKLKSDREGAKRAERVAFDESFRCAECGSSGWVAVPSPKHMKHGKWIPYGSATNFIEITVLCGCSHGEARSRQGNRDTLNLMDYEGWFPRWKEEMERVRAMRAELAKNRSTPTGIAVDIDGIADRLIDRYLEDKERPAPAQCGEDEVPF